MSAARRGSVPQARGTRWQARLRDLGPGLITGAADDDPSGIATYSQAGAAFGYGLLWTTVITWPLMSAIQLVSARIGCATGRGLADNIGRYHARWLQLTLVSLLLLANGFNICADIAAMGEALRLVVGGPAAAYAALFGVLCVVLQVFVHYRSYVRYLKWLTLALLCYVAVAFTVHISVREMLRGALWPQPHFDRAMLMMIVAVLGTTISPYLFFWQASGEVEEAQHRGAEGGQRAGERRGTQRQRARLNWDTIAGMGFSNLVAFFIMLGTAATLHAAGVRDIQSAAQAAEALRPVAGELTFLLFSIGIIGTGLLAVPVLAGSAAYAVAECFGWPAGLDLAPLRARGFYAIIALATLGGLGLVFAHANPMRLLLWSAVLNGFVAVPIMVVLMRLSARRSLMGDYTPGPGLRLLGWVATGVMALAAAGMLATLI